MGKQLLAKTKKAGFTLMELLVVVAIIGLLASIVLASLHNSRKYGEASQLLQQLQEVEKALKILSILENFQQWPDYNGPSGSQYLINHQLPNLIGNNPPPGFASFGELFSSAPQPLGGGQFGYDARNPNYFCSPNAQPDNVNHDSGVSIRVSHTGGANSHLIELTKILDQNIDNGDGPACGRIKWGGSSYSIYYIIAQDLYDI